MQLLKLVQHQVRLDVPLPWNVRNEHGKLLLAQGQLLADDAPLATLLDCGAYVAVEQLKAARRAKLAAATGAAPPATLFAIWEAAIWRLDRLLRSAGLDPAFPRGVDDLARHGVGLAERDADIGIFVSVRQDQKRFNAYALTHAVHTSKVCFLKASRMGWNSDQVLALTKAALTMNIATLDLQGRLAVLGLPPTAN